MVLVLSALIFIQTSSSKEFKLVDILKNSNGTASGLTEKSCSTHLGIEFSNSITRNGMFYFIPNANIHHIHANPGSRAHVCKINHQHFHEF